MTRRTHINGVPVETWGTWCPHDKHVIVADPTDDSEYPRGVFATPWPCDRCTPQQLIEEERHETEEHLQAQWAEYRNMTYTTWLDDCPTRDR